jgi:hypothetical protein
MSDNDPKYISGEHGVFTTHKHWAALIVDSGWAILMIAGSIVLTWLQPENTGMVLGFISRVMDLLRLGLFFGGVGWIIYNIVAWRTAEYTVTNLRVLGHEGLIRRRSTDTLLSSLSDIRTIVPALGGLLGYGHIRIISAAGEAGKDTFTAVKDAEGFKRQVLEQKSLLTATGSTARPAAAQPAELPAASASPQPMPPTSWQDPNQLLGQLANLRDAGLITPEEYNAKKVALLARG